MLTAKQGRWRELDAGTSSSALLMNVFCASGLLNRSSTAIVTLSTQFSCEDLPQTAPDYLSHSGSGTFLPPTAAMAHFACWRMPEGPT